MKLKRWLPVIAMLLAVMLLLACFHGRGQRKWENMQWSRLAFDGGLERSGPDYGEMNSGPALSVGGGTYTLSWDIETDADNFIHVRTANDAGISPDDLVIRADQPQGSATFTSLDEMDNLQIIVDYQAGSYLKVNRIDLTGHKRTNGVFTLTFLLLGAAALSALHASGWLTPGRRGALVIFLAAVFIASTPDLRPNLVSGHDAQFHMGRVLNMVNAMRSGQFPVRLGAFLQNGYGAALSAFYPDLFLYLPAFMVMMGATLVYSFHVLFIAMHLLSALTMWYAAAKLFRSETAGVGASVFYTLCQYRLMDIYTRFAVGEALAMCFLPLFVLGLYEVLWGDQRRWKLLAVSAALICQSHLITTAFCGVIAVGIGVLSCVHVIKERRLGAVLKAIAAALLLNAFFFAPMYTYGRQQVITSFLMHDLSEEAISLAQVFYLPDRDVIVHDPEIIAEQIGLGMPMLIAAVAALHAALTHEKRERSDVLALLGCAAGMVLTLMATNLFPWSRASSMTGGMINYIQFPWRLLTFASVCFAFAGGYALMRLKKEDGAVMQLAVLALCAVCVMPVLSDETRKAEFTYDGALPHWDLRFADYALINANLRSLDSREPVVSPGIMLKDFDKFGTQITAYISAQEDGTIMMPLYAFDGYTAQLGGQPLTIERGEAEHMLLRIKAGMEGELRVGFEGKAYWKVFDFVSLATVLGLIVLSIRDKKRAKA